MTTRPRAVSPTNYYHVMSRGNNKSKIFNCNKDCMRFLEYLKHISDTEFIDIISYCIMPNHYHLLIRIPRNNPNIQNQNDNNSNQSKNPLKPGASGPIESLSRVMHRLNTCYAHFYTYKYDFVGHIFQGRYQSKAIDSKDYLRRVIRYIHQNPVKAGLVSRTPDYPFSSYHEFITKSNFKIIAHDIDNILLELGLNDEFKFRKYHLQQSLSSLMEDYYLFEEKSAIKEEELLRAHSIKQKLGGDMKALTAKERMNFAKQLMRSTSLSQRTIAKIAGVSRSNLKRTVITP